MKCYVQWYNCTITRHYHASLQGNSERESCEGSVERESSSNKVKRQLETLINGSMADDLFDTTDIQQVPATKNVTDSQDDAQEAPIIMTLQLMCRD
jgi:hypothetical protein